MKVKLFFLMLAIAITGCYYDNEEELYNCSVNDTRFSTTIGSILTSYGCKGCHGGAVPSGGINFETHAGVKAMADNGKLYGAITHSPGFEPMPQGGTKMSGCDISKVKAWIDAGAPNN